MSKELAIIDLIGELTGQTVAMADDAFWDADSRLIYTTDMLVENRHFSTDYFSPQDLGWKAATVNISDIAAMGGQLKYLLVSLCLPDNLGLDWVHAFYEGLLAASQPFGGKIVGGDTVSGEIITLNVTAVGTCPTSHHIGRRCNAETGDYIIATGFHGLSKVGLTALQNRIPSYEAAKKAHLRPTPKIEAGLLLSSRFDRYALMDSSDGLADALLKIANASGKTLAIQQSDIPIHPEITAFQQVAADAGPQPLWQTVLYGGEDFELVGAVPSVDEKILEHFTVIGRVEATEGNTGAYLVDGASGQRQPLSLSKTYQHFEASHA